MKNYKLKIGENRLVFNVQQPDKALEAAEKPTLADLKAGAQRNADKEATDILGHPLSPDIVSDPDSFAEAVTHLEESYDKFDQSLDRLYAVFAAKGISKEEVEPYVEKKDRNEPWENPDTADTTDPEPKDWKDKHINTSWKDHNHAERAAKKLKEIPDLAQYVKESSGKHGVPESTIISVIEMESGWNIKSKCPTTSATGLCQAIDKTWNRYKREIGDSNAQRTDPKAAIDFVGWYCKDLVSTVNHMIDKAGPNSGFKQEYKISAADIENLYMAYNNGPAGYLVLRRYVDNPTDQNFNNLTGFQKKIKHGKHGWEHRYNYAKSVARVAKAYRESYGDSIPA